MPDTTLIAGPYRMPRCRVGRTLVDLRYGDSVVAGITDAPVPWPYCARGRGKRSLILAGDLLRAAKSESIAALMHHFGVSESTAYQWRKALDVPRMNEGTKAAWHRIAPAKLATARAARRFEKGRR